MFSQTHLLSAIQRSKLNKIQFKESLNIRVATRAVGIRLQRRQQILSRYLTAVMNGLNMFELTWVRIQATENRKIKESNRVKKLNTDKEENDHQERLFEFDISKVKVSDRNGGRRRRKKQSIADSFFRIA